MLIFYKVGDRKADTAHSRDVAQSAGLRVGVFDDKAGFQEFELTALKPTLTIASQQRRWPTGM